MHRNLTFRGARPALAILIAAALVGPASAAPPRAPRSRLAQAVRDVRHPIEVRVSALGPVVRGQTLRLRLAITPTRAFEAAQAQLVSTGGATLAGAGTVNLGALRRDETRTADFDVLVPTSGHRFLVQFKVEGRAENGPVTRGATWNILPDGPADPGRRIVTPEGAVLEFGARRIAE